MYWALFPFDYEGDPTRGKWEISQEQKKEIQRGITFSDPHFTIEPIGDKHKEQYKK